MVWTMDVELNIVGSPFFPSFELKFGKGVLTSAEDKLWLWVFKLCRWVPLYWEYNFLIKIRRFHGVFYIPFWNSGNQMVYVYLKWWIGRQNYGREDLNPNSFPCLIGF